MTTTTKYTMDAAIAGHADAVMALIAADVADGIVPRDVASFAGLHAYIDANEYAIQAGIPTGTDEGSGADGAGTVNAVESECDRRIRAGELGTLAHSPAAGSDMDPWDTCSRCGQPIRADDRSGAWVTMLGFNRECYGGLA